MSRYLKANPAARGEGLPPYHIEDGVLVDDTESRATVRDYNHYTRYVSPEEARLEEARNAARSGPCTIIRAAQRRAS